MCNKHNPRKIDNCMALAILKLRSCGLDTVACCCGHGKYPMTIVYKLGLHHYELFTGRIITRKKRFYKKDKQGYYYIPEAILDEKGNILGDEDDRESPI